MNERVMIIIIFGIQESWPLADLLFTHRFIINFFNYFH